MIVVADTSPLLYLAAFRELNPRACFAAGERA